MSNKVDIAELRECVSRFKKAHSLADISAMIWDVFTLLPALLDELEAARNFRMASGMAVTDYDSGDSVDFSHLPKGEAD